MRLALFGQPVRHSLSPQIHQLFARQAGLKIDYRAIDTAPGKLVEALGHFAESGGTGCNITVPLKGEARELAAQSSARAALAGAANTLTLADGQWLAESTDGPGLLMDLERLGVAFTRRRVALIGAGGAAASVLSSLLGANPQSVDVFNRTGARAKGLARRHEHLGAVNGHDLASLGSSDAFDLVINATSMGHSDTLPPVHSTLLVPGGFFYDMNYGPAAKPLTHWCREHGVAHSAGLGMLLGQAAESFTIWTDYRPEIEPVLALLA